MRGIAILGVLAIHSDFAARQSGRMFMVAFTGQRGVQLFYLVSAFTLFLSLDNRRQEHYPLSNYVLRRFFRIAPLAYAAIGMNLLLFHLMPRLSSLEGLRPRDILLGFLFLNGWSQRTINAVIFGGWSVAVETSFYLVLPLLFRWIRSVRAALIAIAIVLPCVSLLDDYLAGPGAEFGKREFYHFFWFPAEFPVFLLGILAYWVWKQYLAGRSFREDSAKDLSLLLLGASLVVYVLAIRISNKSIFSFSCLFLPLLLALDLHSWPLFVNRFTRFLGKISFSFYLAHVFVIIWLSDLLQSIDEHPAHLASRYVFGHLGGFVGVYLLTLAISIPISMLTWMLIEQPGIRLGRRVINLREGRVLRRNAARLVPSLSTLASEKNTGDAQF